MCLICQRINMIQEGTNPYFVKELETGYVVMGDHQHFQGYTLFLCKEHRTELFHLDAETKQKYLNEMALVAEAVSLAFGAEKMNYELLGNGDVTGMIDLSGVDIGVFRFNAENVLGILFIGDANIYILAQLGHSFTGLCARPELATVV